MGAPLIVVCRCIFYIIVRSPNVHIHVQRSMIYTTYDRTYVIGQSKNTQYMVHREIQGTIALITYAPYLQPANRREGGGGRVITEAARKLRHCFFTRFEAI